MTAPERNRVTLENHPEGLLDASRGALWVGVLMAAMLVIIPVQMVAHRLGWRMQRLLPMVFHRLALTALGARLRVSGTPAANRPLLIVSNHISWMDILVLGSQMPLSFVAKSEVATWPVFGVLAKLQRCIFVDRKRRSSTGRTANEMGERMKQGDPIVLFAEGTSGDGNVILPFKPALIGAGMALAQETGSVHIQPVVIAYTRLNGCMAGRQHRSRLAWTGDLTLIPHCWSMLKLGAIDVELVYLEPQAVTPQTDRKRLARDMEGMVRDVHSKLLRC